MLTPNKGSNAVDPCMSMYVKCETLGVVHMCTLLAAKGFCICHKRGFFALGLLVRFACGSKGRKGVLWLLA